MAQTTYDSAQKSELYGILRVLLDFPGPVNVVTDSQYAERGVLHIETSELIPYDSETSLEFIQQQQVIRKRIHPLYITYQIPYICLPHPLVQSNDEINQLLMRNVLEASELNRKHYANRKCLKKDFFHHLTKQGNLLLAL